MYNNIFRKDIKISYYFEGLRVLLRVIFSSFFMLFAVIICRSIHT